MGSIIPMEGIEGDLFKMPLFHPIHQLLHYRTLLMIPGEQNTLSPGRSQGDSNIAHYVLIIPKFIKGRGARNPASNGPLLSLVDQGENRPTMSRKGGIGGNPANSLLLSRGGQLLRPPPLRLSIESGRGGIAIETVDGKGKRSYS